VIFNSLEFLIFLPLVFILYWFVFDKKLSLQNGLILVASYFFYGWWSWKFMGLLMLSTILDYKYGFYVASSNRKRAKMFLWLSVINNLGILAIFKYFNFFIEQFQNAFELIGFQTNPIILNIALPVGISFYTFHGMSYVFDIYRGHQKPVSSFIDYAVFVSFFPLLVAGPIERANHLLPQVQQNRKFNYNQALVGCRLILWGIFKKVVVADNSAYFANEIFNNYEIYNGSAMLLGVLFFTIQIYGDFSGYSDIALGTAKLFGFDLLINFRFPYFSRDLAEFWKRWHISLSSWFRDYLYIPLGGSKEGKNKAIRNTFIIFLVSGFWHGASWNFIAWGFAHACGFLPLLLLQKSKLNTSDSVAQNSILPSAKEAYGLLTTFIFVMFCWIFFRAPNLLVAFEFFKTIFSPGLFSFPNIKLDNADLLKFAHLMLAVFLLVIFEWMSRRTNSSVHFFDKIRISFLRRSLYVILIFMIFYFKGLPVEFIYFAF
jgi:D-alanyl-lipoteichoic acid acyltransferase DltB (MBOAT superfamily)